MLDATAGLLEQARTAQAEGDENQAEALSQRAQRIDSQNARVYLALSEFYAETGRHSAARSMAERGLLYCQEPVCGRLQAQLR